MQDMAVGWRTPMLTCSCHPTSEGQEEESSTGSSGIHPSSGRKGVGTLALLEGEELSSCSSGQPVFLASWSNLQQGTAEPAETCFQKKRMASGNPRELDPGSQPAQIGEGTLETESVSLAVGEGFPNEISLSFYVKSRSGQGLNPQLHEAARKKLWALENDDKDVCALFKELSARLVCIQAQEDRFLLSFKTVEEIWKFSTYLALGYVGCCLEHLLFTPEYWLNCALVEDTEIRVTIDEDLMATMYLGLLLQEGNFFARAVLNVLAEEEGEDLKLYENELVHVKDIGHEAKWEGTSLLTDQRGLVPVTTIEPLPHPFYQWFLKNYPMSCGISKQISGADSLQTGQGKYTVTEDHRGNGWDELSFCKGDILEVIGFLIPGLPWFIGKSTTSGSIGFVQTKYVHPETYEPTSTFYGFSSEEDLVLYLETSRNWAKRGHLAWAHIRICFLLGRLCVKKAKFSQARVYFEEAMSTMDRGFEDMPLLISLHTNLAAIYLKQKMKQKFLLVIGKVTALLACLPGHCFSSENELEVMMYILREAIAVGNTALEARACFLVVRLFLQLGQYEEVLPFAEHLQFLCICLSSQNSGPPAFDTMPILTYLYDKKYLPHIALASARLFSPSSGKGGLTPIWRAGFILANASKLLNIQESSSSSVPAVSCLYLNCALAFSCESGAVSTERALCAVLSKMYLQHGMLQGAVHYTNRAIALGRVMGEEEAFESSLSLGWIYALNCQPDKASEIMLCLLHSLRQTDSVTQDGVVHNLLAIALKGEGQVLKAAENYLWALNKARETGNRRNQAIALSNFGCLAVSCGANLLAEHYFLQAVRLYFELQGSDDTQMELVQILLWLAQSQVERHKTEESKVFYELALAVALKTHSVLGQLHVTESLCHFHSKVCPNTGACIIYHEHQVRLVQQLQDRAMEGQVLQVLSQLYQSLHTARSLKQALDCTKQSLRIFIDLEETVRTSQAWLQAGRLYYQMQEDELVDMYLQAAIQTALKPEELHLAMELYEEAGDVFFNGIRNRQRAVEYYRGGAVPLARKLKTVRTELRIFNKLTELQIGLRNYENALECATMAVRLSVDVGDQWQEVVAFHRLATVYYFLQMYEMAEDCYLRTLSLRSPLLQGAQEALYYSKVYCRLGDLTLNKLKDEQDAASYFLLALAATTELHDQTWQDKIQARLAQVNSTSQTDKSPKGWTSYRARWLSERRQAV
ncbi:SH3 domain and tetratricopeptide repeat-containing protein 2 isoform X7 [Varanus komodoensis]|uniref:SH3 domain and tetratricopeptide repeat-containing protein 2 isoform X7 n=1 Tax=Varanus komodoensis TaxID=61221 RepID=UPI001CF7E046|nr:SH3 domain and tetratricopeptide repeat-containing protein 2 isoform X7 [Varanus komodoensis]